MNEIYKVYSFSLDQEFNNHVDDIKSMIIEGYDELVSINDDINSDSPINLKVFKDTFLNSLNGFNFVETTNDVVTITTPDMENFNFSGLNLLHQVLEGTAGTYLEVSQEDLHLLNIPIINEGIEVNQTNFYLIEYSEDIVSRALNVLNKKLNIFPFSNMSPLDGILFDKATNYVNDNFDIWVKQAVTKSEQLIRQKL